jgi:hypothetical protein
LHLLILDWLLIGAHGTDHQINLFAIDNGDAAKANCLFAAVRAQPTQVAVTEIREI